MRSPRDDDNDVRVLLAHASASWHGPSAAARQARWAAAPPRGPWLSAGLIAAGSGAAVLLAGSLTLVATSRSPNDVVRLVSHVFTTPSPSPAGAPSPSPPASIPPMPAGAPTPSNASRPAPRPVHTPTPVRTGWSDDRPTPTPSPLGSPSPGPSPSPSWPPDE